MVAEDDQGVGAHCLGDAIAAIGRVDLEVLSVVHRLVEDKGARLLADRSERFDVRRPRRTEGGVRVRRCVDVLTHFEQRMMDVVPSNVGGGVGRAVDDRAVGADENQVVHSCLTERHAVAQHPEVIAMLWITTGDVAVAELPPAHRSEDSISDRRLPLPELPALVDAQVDVAPGAVGDVRIGVELKGHGRNPALDTLRCRTIAEPARAQEDAASFRVRRRTR